MVSSPLRLWTISLAGVEDHETAGAVGVLGLAGIEAGLADGGGLLVAQVAADRNLALERPVASVMP